MASGSALIAARLASRYQARTRDGIQPAIARTYWGSIHGSVAEDSQAAASRPPATIEACVLISTECRQEVILTAPWAVR